jgi:hypothetical protein
MDNVAKLKRNMVSVPGLRHAASSGAKERRLPL